MAVETDYPAEDRQTPSLHNKTKLTDLRDSGSWPFGSAALPLRRRLVPLAQAVDRLFERLADTFVVRFVSSTLLRRIIVSNLLGLVVLLFGVLYLSQFNVWLIDAKRESLQSQGRIIAGAIASSLSRDGETDRPTGIRGSLLDDPFADLSFSLGPELVTPVLRRLLVGTSNRARVYDRKGNLVADSVRQLPPLGLQSRNAKGENTNRPTTKNLWTRMKEWFLSSDLNVYKDLRDANGRLYPEVRTAMKGRSEALLLLTRSGRQIVSVAIPIELAGDVQGVLLLSTRPGEVDDALAEERFGIMALALVALAAAMLASYLLARTVAGPMRTLSAAAQKVTRNIRSARNLPKFEAREDEVGQLSQSFQSMTKALLRRIDASEKFAADVAHELKNPLTAARSTAESLIYAKSDAQRDALVVQIQEELKRLNKLITDVSNASRMDAELALHEPEPIDLADVAKGISQTFQDIISDTGKRVQLSYDSSAAASGAYFVAGHEGRLAQVLTNLIDNALSFSPDSGVVDVNLRRQGSDIVLTVTDQGPGIEADKLQTIFSRFYTYRPTNEGSRGNNSGLGLSISRDIILVHGGEVWAENRASADQSTADDQHQTGARFIVRLPATDTARPASQRNRNSGAGSD
ncbi:MAG: stimulus-sensing domain-containing protein [Hyphomicrobiaceae bacterium]